MPEVHMWELEDSFPSVHLPEKMTVMMDTFRQFAERHQLSYWCDFGTLLGLVRGGGPIPWDNDVDLSMFSHDAEKLIEALDKEGIKYAWPISAQGSEKKIRGGLIHIYGQHALDVWFWGPRDFQVKETSAVAIAAQDTDLWCDHPWTRETRLPSRHVQMLATIVDSRGIEWPIPEDSRSLLALRYGADWETPRKDVVGETREKHVSSIGTGPLPPAPLSVLCEQCTSSVLLLTLRWREREGDEPIIAVSAECKPTALATAKLLPWFCRTIGGEDAEAAGAACGSESTSAIVNKITRESDGSLQLLLNERHPAGEARFSFTYKIKLCSKNGWGPWSDSIPFVYHDVPSGFEAEEEVEQASIEPIF